MTDREQEKENENVDKEEEKALRAFDFYHGFLSREDLGSLLKREGDYLLRVSEVENAKDVKKASREIVLSLMAYAQQDDDFTLTTTSGQSEGGQMLKKRNVIIKRVKGLYQMETKVNFHSVKELIEFYKANTGLVNKILVKLKTPIGPQKWEFPHSDVQLTKLLGEGAYGEVRAGHLKQKNGESLNVAVKMAKGTGELSKAKIKEMMKEARLMRDLSHPNIVNLYGVAVFEQPLYILLELVDGGALNSHLKSHIGSVHLKEKMSMCLGAAMGLEYIHKKGCMHRDMAARNCLYTSDKVVKISDFGLSKKATSYKVRTQTKLPIKWLAPETLTTFIFTMKSDVYSYGVLVFEIFADGVEPWDGLTNGQTRKELAEGRHVQIANSCPEKFRVFVNNSVLLKEPTKRVIMADVVRVLETLKTESANSEGPYHSLAHFKKIASKFGSTPKKEKEASKEASKEA